jgi:hypothetical protein
MGTMILFIAVSVFIMAVLTFGKMEGPARLIWTIRIGMLFLLVSQLFGQLIIVNGIPKVIDMSTGDFVGVTTGSTAPNVYGLEGLMKLPHFLTLHAIQTLPFLALLLPVTPFKNSRKNLMVALAALGYTGLVAVVTLQVFLGKSTFDLSPIGWGILGVSGLAASLPFLVAMAGARAANGNGSKTPALGLEASG